MIHTCSGIINLRSKIVQSITLICCWMGITAAQADEAFPEKTPEVKTYEWTLSPAREPRFALQYKLFSPLEERIPGNAATHYYRAMLLDSDLPKETPAQIDRLSEWFDLPYDKLPLDEIKKWLESRRNVLGELKVAARCETCEWGTRFQDLRGSEVLTVLLHEYQKCRHLARILRLQARIEIAERRFDEAIATIRQMYRLANDLGIVPSVIVNLIGIAIQSLASESLGELMATEGSPNMYWALRGLPDPVVNLWVGWRFEWSMAFRMFPYLIDADTARRSELEWRNLLAATYIEYDDLNPKGESVTHQAAAMVRVMCSYPLAKQELIAAGYDAAKIEQMPAAQVVAIFARDCNRFVADEVMKCTLRPVSPSIDELRAVRLRLEQTGYLCVSSESVADHDPLKINTELGLFENLLEANARQPRTIAALTAIEGIRMYAAAHDGKLPATLADLTAAPAPVNPTTGKSILYRVVGDQAELLLPPTRPGDTYSGRRFLIRIRK